MTASPVVAAADALARAHERRGGNAFVHWAYCTFCGARTEASVPVREVPHSTDCLAGIYLAARSKTDG